MSLPDRVNAFRFYGNLHGIKLRSGDFSEAFEKQAMVLIRNATRMFLRTLILRVPVWTGFTRGAIKFAKGPNGDLAAFLNVAVPIQGVHRYPKWYYPKGGGRRIRKIPENSGRFGEYNFTSSRHVYQFTFRLDVIQFLINEFYSNVSYTSPWNSLKVAKEAFHDYIQFNAKRSLPRVNKFLDRYDVELNPGKNRTLL